jgi:hypothetical protein
MIVFQNRKEFFLEKINEEDNTTSTLLIPAQLLEDFLKHKAKYHQNTSLYLRSLIRRFRSITHSGLLPDPMKIKTEYQDKKLELKKISLRPRNSDWLELGALALAFGKSRCWMFVYLLKLDILGLWEILVRAGLKKIVPTIPRLELQSFWNLEKVMNNFARGYHIKV